MLIEPGQQQEAPAYALSPGAIIIPVLDGSARVVDLDGYFCAISPVGAQMLEATLRLGAYQAARDIAVEYGADARQVREDLDKLLHSLEKMRFVHRPPKQSFCKGRDRLASFLITASLRIAYSLFSSPEERANALLIIARAAVAVFGWNRTVVAWRSLDNPTCPTSDETGREKAAKEIDAAVSSAMTGHLLRVACKERALCCWSLAGMAALPASLIVGVSLFPLEAHCWCESGQRVLGDDPDHCRQYIPIARYEYSG